MSFARPCSAAGSTMTQVAPLQHIRQAARRGPEIARPIDRPRPGKVGQRDGAGGVPRIAACRRRRYGISDPGLDSALLQHHAKPPVGQHPRRAGHLRQRILPVAGKRDRIADLAHRPAPAAMGAVVVHQPSAQGAIGHSLQRPDRGWYGRSARPRSWRPGRSARSAGGATSPSNHSEPATPSGLR